MKEECKKRLVAERQELAERLSRLVQGIGGDIGMMTTKEQLDLLNEQAVIMVALLAVLTDRARLMEASGD